MTQASNVSTMPPSAQSADPARRRPPRGGSPKATGAWRRRLVTAGHAALSLGLCAYLVAGIDATQLRVALAAADRTRVVAALLVLAVVPVLAAERWLRTCAATGIRAGRGFIYPAAYAGMFAGQFLPSALGMDAVRLALLWRQRVGLSAGIQSLAIDRGCGVAALAALAVGGLPFTLDRLPPGLPVPAIALTLLGVAAGVALLFADRLPVPRWLRQGPSGRVLALLRATRAAICTRDVLVAFLLGGAIHLIAIFAVLLLARAFGFELHYRDLLTLTAAAIFVSMLPVSFNGWGVREGALMLGLSLLAVPREIALLIAFLYGAGGALASLPGSLSWRRLRAPADGTGQDSRSA